MEELNFYQRLTKLQNELKAPKNQFNKFGNYKYRSCEDIVEAVKPLLEKYNLSLTITDEIVLIGDRYYVKATARLIGTTSSGGEISTTAYARESKDRKGMDDSQITGATSSYARKYALNGLFAIDDTKDADTDEYKKQENIVVKKKENILDNGLIEKLESLGGTVDMVATYLKKNVEEITNEDLIELIERKEKKKKNANV